MRKLIQVPIEPLDMRYSTQWHEWFTDAIRFDGRFEELSIVATPLTDKIENGAFLDICGTNYYKAQQLQELCRMLHTKQINNGDVIFFHDAWFPGMEMLAYIRDAMKLDFKIAGCLHAGTYDSTDYISKMGMGNWGMDLENSWFRIYDMLFVATTHHRDLILKNRILNPFRIINTGFPIFMPKVDMGRMKEDIVVFPHRLTEDKQPQLFDELARVLGGIFPNWQFIKTQDVPRTKQDYYNLLRRCKIAVSFATHENWGIGMQEAVMLGCLPVVPDRLSYKEMYNEEFRYSDLSEAIYKTNKIMLADSFGYPEHFIKIAMEDKETIINNGKNAIPNMLGAMYVL